MNFKKVSWVKMYSNLLARIPLSKDTVGEDAAVLGAVVVSGNVADVIFVAVFLRLAISRGCVGN